MTPYVERAAVAAEDEGIAGRRGCMSVLPPRGIWGALARAWDKMATDIICTL